MAASCDLPSGGVVFPERCIGCSAAPDGTCDITASSGVDLVLFRFAYSADVPAPICASCRGRRRLWYYGSVAALVGSIVALVAVYAAFEKEPLVKAYGMGAVVVYALVTMWWSRNRLERLIDRRLLGVEGVAVLRKSQQVRLRFREQALADEVAQNSTGPGRAPGLDVETA